MFISYSKNMADVSRRPCRPLPKSNPPNTTYAHRTHYGLTRYAPSSVKIMKTMRRLRLPYLPPVDPGLLSSDVYHSYILSWLPSSVCFFIIASISACIVWISFCNFDSFCTSSVFSLILSLGAGSYEPTYYFPLSS